MLYGQIKTASFLGRYANMHTLPMAAALQNSPNTEFGLSLLDMVTGSSANPITNPVIQSFSNNASLGYGDNNRLKSLQKTDKKLQEKGYIDNMMEQGGNFAGPGAVLGALGGGISGGIPGAGLGAIAGGLGAGIGGAGVGALTKFISNNTSKDSKARAMAMKAKHPYLTNLPLGSMIGATLA